MLHQGLCQGDLNRSQKNWILVAALLLDLTLDTHPLLSIPLPFLLHGRWNQALEHAGQVFYHWLHP